MADKYEPVTFENSLGETISNDPYFLAQRTMEQYAALPAEQQGMHAPKGAGSDDSDEDIDNGDTPSEKPYADLKGPALKALAADRGVDISGLTKVGEVRAALVADDEAKAKAEADAAAQAEVDAAN